MDTNVNASNFTFLMCSERSGSNFITKLMNNHSQICGPSTKHIINPLARNYFRYQPFDIDENWDALLNDMLNLFHVSFSVWKSNFTFDELKANIARGDLKGLVSYFFNKEAQINTKSHVFIKEIKLDEFYPFLKSYFPNSNYVYQVRDPRDMALSWKKNKTHKGGIVAAAKQWKNDQQQYLKIKALEEMNGNIHFMKYEDLVSNTKIVVGPALKMMGLFYEPGMVDMGKDELTNENARQQKAWENLSKPVIKDNFNKFKSELSDNEIKYVESICYFEMLHFGYKPLHEWQDLEKIPGADVENFHRTEMKDLEYNPVSGVLENMKAKKRFYQYV